MEIDYNYGWNNNNFMLYPKDTILNPNDTTILNSNDIYTNTNKKNRDNNVSKRKHPKDLKIKKEKVNHFPMAWTCYKDNTGNWICPLRGD